ncbi:MAG: hemerythrin domain-containing protein [Nocardioidaceae bacterium]
MSEASDPWGEPLPDWDESARPVPPAFPEATPHDLAAGEHLRAVHDMFRGGLVTVGAVVDRVVGGEAGVGEARAAIHELGLAEAYQQLGSYCGQLCSAVQTHHGLEDAVLYPALRAADAELRPSLDRLALEHEVIHDVLVRLDATLVALVSEPARVDRLAAEFRQLRRLLESHFLYEEQAIGTALGVHRVMG